jgi:hypothetical protein
MPLSIIELFEKEKYVNLKLELIDICISNIFIYYYDFFVFILFPTEISGVHDFNTRTLPMKNQNATYMYISDSMY